MPRTIKDHPLLLTVPQAAELMAEKLGINPFELRRRNAVYPGATSVGGEVLQYSMGMMDTIDQCEQKLRQALKEYEGQYPKGSKVLGWGVASGFKNVGVGKGIFTDDGACRLTLGGDGRLRMVVSGTDMGQGFLHRPAFFQQIPHKHPRVKAGLSRRGKHAGQARGQSVLVDSVLHLHKGGGISGESVCAV